MLNIIIAALIASTMFPTPPVRATLGGERFSHPDEVLVTSGSKTFHEVVATSHAMNVIITNEPLLRWECSAPRRLSQQGTLKSGTFVRASDADVPMAVRECGWVR